MKIVIDNQIVNMLVHNAPEIKAHPVLFASNQQISFRWPSFLESLELGSIMTSLPVFDENATLFQAIVATLSTTEEKEVIFYLYDHLFAEILTQIKALPQIKIPFLIQAMEEKALFSSLNTYKTAFIEKTADTIHDLILYLAWDRMCVCIGRLFSCASMDLKFIHGLEVLKECLLESYQHISRQKRTIPSFYRMVEALFFYQMREENLQKHTADQWKILTQSFVVIQAEEKLADCFYIDDIISLEEDLDCYWVSDSIERVSVRIALVQCILDIMQSEFPDSGCFLCPKKIVYLSLQAKSS